MDKHFAATASLLAEPTRAVMLLKLMGGKALPAGELAKAANISAQTASGHLAKLLEANLLRVETQGRHRFYRLTGTEVADVLEAILVLLPHTREGRSSGAQPKIGTLPHARTCYSHLAGWLGVRITDALQEEGYLRMEDNRRFGMTRSGRVWFENLGADLSNSSGRQCPDWTERRPHLAGPLGVALFRRLVELRWLAPIPETRSVRVTLKGKRELWARLRIPLR